MHRYVLLILRHQCKLRLSISTTLPTYLSLPNSINWTNWSNWSDLSNFDHFAHLIIFAKFDQFYQLDQLDQSVQLVQLVEFVELVEFGSGQSGRNWLWKTNKVRNIAESDKTKSKRSLHWCRSISKKISVQVLLQYQSKSYYIIGQEVYYIIGRFLLHYRAVITVSGVYYIIGWYRVRKSFK